MDSNAATEVGEMDMISNLHESILGHILSSLLTIEAIRTNVLSRRWIHVWKSIKSLKFDDSLLIHGKKMQKEEFVCFVNTVLFHLANSTIQSFSLCLTSYNYDSPKVSAWISSVLERGVQKLNIQYADNVPLSSNSLFSCNSLVELVLQMRCTLNAPISSCLPNLQSLHLSGVRLVSDSPTYSNDITLSFPVLKVFEARVCEWSTMQDICIQAPLLERLSIKNSLSNEACKSAIQVFSTCLTDFSYEGDLEQEIILFDPSSIRSASVVIVIDEDGNDRIEELVFQARKLLGQIHQVEQLKLLFYKVLIHAKDIFTHLPAFGRLNNLQLNEVTGEALLHLFHHSPFLNTLVLLNGVCDLNKDVLTAASVPHCFLSSFKVFQFNGFNVKEPELCLVKFVLANAAILERVTICTAFWLRYSDIDMGKVKEQILSLPKCSRLCKIEFCDVNGF
ncbi:F-box/FBD/LRR-repeat protein At3g14710-like [Lotus japonicus]|uniref:F-box/FBD/LRR-repeat protein At3g14710-like n=1 Tax=Lotus japonicus TaxID=34305 RepID=UPI0025866363|nr:F-box/FBD/LRR-repeat protein At3g14710-like [Lotus japonicus]XP_057458809.1 F-box/FBD/LRR-repeat protein At3g14710-like [Lotus japonicus]